tara:strand:+ start:101412 stop:102074 length:663 start_codon:yes stop_codon:yes gene_type:complete
MKYLIDTINESGDDSVDFTDQFRTNGYNVNHKDQDKVRKMFNIILTKLSDSDPELLADIEKKMYWREDDYWWTGDGEYFISFAFNDDENVWYINSIKVDYYDTEKTMSSEFYSIGGICEILDFIMKDNRVTNLLNSNALRKMNNVKTFESFKSEKINNTNDMIGHAAIGYTPKWKIDFINNRGDDWTARISATDLLELATKMKETMSKEEYNSVYKITKY